MHSLRISVAYNLLAAQTNQVADETPVTTDQCMQSLF